MQLQATNTQQASKAARTCMADF